MEDTCFTLTRRRGEIALGRLRIALAEVRGANGYLILWKDGAKRLAAAIAGPRQLSLFPFPIELIQDHIEPGRLIQFPERPLNPSRSLDLERVQVGARNDSLFDVGTQVCLSGADRLQEGRREPGRLAQAGP